jgi:CRP/FNR family transcriptional regulator, cyclic AMP receptor protein
VRTLEEFVAAAPVFAGLDAAQVATVAGCGRNERFAAGDHLFLEGRPADRFFLIRDGAVALVLVAPGRGAIVIQTLHDGDVAGWSWLFEPYTWQFDGRATAPTSVIAFDAVCLRDKCEADHELGYRLMARFAATAIGRLQSTRLQLLDVYGRPDAG